MSVSNISTIEKKGVFLHFRVLQSLLSYLYYRAGFIYSAWIVLSTFILS